MTIECKQCHGRMSKTKKAETNYTAQIFAVVIFIAGFFLLFLFPIGTIVAPIVMIGAGRMGYRKDKVWMCESCGYYFKRA